MDNSVLSCRFFVEKIENVLHKHFPSRRVSLDEQSRRMIQDRFYIKFRQGSNHHAHISIIYSRKHCVAVGINSVDCHAEVDALKKLLSQRHEVYRHRKRKQLGIVTFRFSKTGVLNNSSPCFHCSQFLRKYIDYFHTISFSTPHGHLCTLSSDVFETHSFYHISRGRHPVKSIPP